MTMDPGYILSAELKGAKGAINTLLFSRDGKLLLSGGDDRCVRVWNTSSFNCEQVLHNSKWGQVTTLTWVYIESPNNDAYTSISVGTGRGSVCLCLMMKESNSFQWKNAKTFNPFNFNNAVEAQAYDPLNQRLVLASHSGQITMYNVETSTTLTQVWTATISNAIPRGLCFFGGANQSLLIHGLETGEMCCRDAQNSNVMWTKTLAGGIGNAALSSDEATLLVDNLSSGNFDVYRFPSSNPSISFSFTATRRFAKQCVFAENAKIAVCGSDNGRVQVVDITTGECLQSLRLGSERDIIQAVAAVTINGENHHLIAGGSTTATPSVYIWEKKLPDLPTEDQNATPKCDTTLPAPNNTKQTIINGFFFTLVMLMTYPNWSPYFWKLIASVSTALAHGANHVANFSGTVTPGGSYTDAPDTLGVFTEGLKEAVKEVKPEVMKEVVKGLESTGAIKKVEVISVAKVGVKEIARRVPGSTVARTMDIITL